MLRLMSPKEELEQMLKECKRDLEKVGRKIKDINDWYFDKEFGLSLITIDDIKELQKNIAERQRRLSELMSFI